MARPRGDLRLFRYLAALNSALRLTPAVLEAAAFARLDHVRQCQALIVLILPEE